jgi:alkanesulfonate monooxygenase SsuD/methylene tetrahydromethanopterin reductase-like flavin-dependent oxidoreductase (luciferase family)
LIGGSGEQKTLRFVARYANACNIFAVSPEIVQHKLDVLARHCDAEGRNPDEIEKTILAMSNPSDDVDEFLRSMAQYAEMGVTLVEVMPLVPDPAAWVTQLGETLVPRLQQL